MTSLGLDAFEIRFYVLRERRAGEPLAMRQEHYKCRDAIDADDGPARRADHAFEWRNSLLVADAGVTRRRVDDDEGDVVRSCERAGHRHRVRASRIGARSSPNSKMTSLRGYILARQGRRREAEAVLTTLEAIARERYVPPYALALVHAGLGQRDLAFAWLGRAYAAHDVHLTWLPQDAKWDPFRDDPRFRELLERCNFMRTARTSGHAER